MELPPHLFKPHLLYAAMVNGGKLITPSIIKDRQIKKSEKIISKETSINYEKF